MENIIDKMCQCENLSIIRDLEDSVYTIALNEYPHNWKGALVKIGENLTKQDEKLLYGTLCALKGIVKRYKTVQALERIPLHEITEGAFPILETLMQNLINSDEDKHQMLITVMLKIFYLSNYVVKYSIKAI